MAFFMCKNDSETEISILCFMHRPQPILCPLRVKDEYPFSSYDFRSNIIEASKIMVDVLLKQ